MSSETAAPPRRGAPTDDVTTGTAADTRLTTPPPASTDPQIHAADRTASNAESSESGSAGTGVICRLEELLTERSMTMTELSQRTGITMANLSVLKNNKAKAIRMSTIAALCTALDVVPGQLLVLDPPVTADGVAADDK